MRERLNDAVTRIVGPDGARLYWQVYEEVRDALGMQKTLRELGDASKWALIAWVNGLRAPYIVSSVAELTTDRPIVFEP